MPTHTVAEGDCLSSIAEHYGFFWESLWNHPNNAPLREGGRHPNTLVPGDAVFIPEKRTRDYTRRTGARHTFQIRGVPVRLVLHIEVDGKPRANEPYVLEVDGVRIEGSTDGSGTVSTIVRPGARHGTLTVGEGEEALAYNLELGELAPPDTLEGAQARLRNLGYRSELNGELDDAMRDALRAFQSDQGLAPDGEFDSGTQEKLRTVHDGG